MSSLLYSLGRWAFRARRLVIGAWIILLALLGGGALLFGQGLDNNISIPGTESQNALDSLATTFPQASGASALMIVVAPDGASVDDTAITKTVKDAVADLDDIDQVARATSPYDKNVTGVISDDESAALISIQLDGANFEITPETKTALRDAAADLESALPDGSTVSLGGQLFSQSLPSLSLIELIGVGIALIVLLLTFGSFRAAGMPLLTAMIGVAVSMTLIFIATAFAPITSTTPMLALMLGLAVGIDYALFIISRHLDQLKHGLTPEESAARSLATSGSAVVFAGLTVMIALLGLGVAGIPFLTTMGVAAAVAVAVAVLVSLTLVPAILGVAGEKLRPKKSLPLVEGVPLTEPVPVPLIEPTTLPLIEPVEITESAEMVSTSSTSGEESAELVSTSSTSGRDSAEMVSTSPTSDGGSSTNDGGSTTNDDPHRPNRFFLGWVRTVTRFPLVTIAVVVAALGFAAVPALGLKLALPDAGGLPEENPARVTYDLVSDRFGEGFNGPLIVTGSIITSTDPLGLMSDLKDEIENLPGVAAVPLATPNQTADTGIIQVIPEHGPDSDETKALVQELRSKHDYFLEKYDVDLSVTGFTAVGIDVSDKLGGALLPFGILVVGLSLILLTMVFRSIAVPIKATLGYLLSVGASFGAVALVFQNGVLADVLHVAKTGPIISFMPIILMGVLFGLAMDYEVFLVARMREDFVHGGNARRAVETGFTSSAKVVTAAAIIMIAVFAAFVPEGDANMKPIALGLAVGVFVDAFIVRMTLVPAVLAVLGDKAWWMPKWLDRALPSFDVEGEGLARELELQHWPEPGSTAVVAASGLTIANGGETLLPATSLRVELGATHVVTGDDHRAITAVLLAVTGRMHVDAGRLKVLGSVLPGRAARVRSRAAYVSLAASADPVARVLAAVRERPQLLAIDGLDRVTDAASQRAIGELLHAAHRDARTPLTVIIGAVDMLAVHDIVTPDSTTIVGDIDSNSLELAPPAEVNA